MDDAILTQRIRVYTVDGDWQVECVAPGRWTVACPGSDGPAITVTSAQISVLTDPVVRDAVEAVITNENQRT